MQRTLSAFGSSLALALALCTSGPVWAGDKDQSYWPPDDGDACFDGFKDCLHDPDGIVFKHDDKKICLLSDKVKQKCKPDYGDYSKYGHSRDKYFKVTQTTTIWKVEDEHDHYYKDKNKGNDYKQCDVKEFVKEKCFDKKWKEVNISYCAQCKPLYDY